MSWAFWEIHLFDFHRDRGGTNLNFRISETHSDRVFLNLAHHPIIGLILVSFAVLVGADAFAGSREKGYLRTLQSLPYKRCEVFLGVIVSRVLAVTTVVPIVVVLAFLWAHQLSYEPSITVLALFTIIFGVHIASFVCVGVALSVIKRRRTAIHGLALMVAIGTMIMYVPLSRFGSETAVIAPRQVLYALTAALDERWNVLSGLSIRAAIFAQLLLIIVPLFYAWYRYEHADLLA